MIRLDDRGAWTYVTGECSPDEWMTLRSLLVLPLPEGTGHPWARADGLLHLLRETRGGGFRFPRGCTPEVLARLERHGVRYQHAPDERWPRHYDASGWEDCAGRLLNDQQRWAASCMWSDRCGILELFTRFGKSYVLATAWVAAGRPSALVLVPTKDIAKQFAAEASEFLREPVGVVCRSLGRVEPGRHRITVATMGSLVESVDGDIVRVREECREWLAGIEALYWDECHQQGDRMLLLHTATEDRLISWGLSASPFTDDPVKDTVLVALTGPVRARLTVADGAALGMISSAEVRWYEMPVYADAMRQAPAAYADYYRQLVVGNRDLNELWARVVAHHVAHGDPVVVFVDRVEHGRILADLMPEAMAYVGRGSNSELQRDFNEGRVPCVIVTKRWRLGVTLRTNVLINAEGLAAPHVVVQRTGRGLLLKDDRRPLVVYDAFIEDAPRGTLARQGERRRGTYTECGWQQRSVGRIVARRFDELAPRERTARQ